MTELQRARARGPAPYSVAADLRGQAGGWASSLHGERLAVFSLVLVGLVAHGLNMFNYPAFTFSDTEGLTAVQGWAVLRQQAFSPYTYVWDHPPVGPIALGAWTWLTGGYATFGGAIQSGRVLMLVLHLAMIPLVFHLARKLGGGTPTATLATLLFSLSPLALFYQRLLLFDTLALYFLLLSLNLLLDGWGRLSRVALSGGFFGLAVLTREAMLVFAPALLFIAVQQRWRHQGRFAVAGWIVPALVVISWYPLAAIFKHELFPRPAAGVSLLGALSTAATASGGSDFWGFFRSDWLRRDPVLLVGGVAATAINLIRGVRWRRLGERPAFAAGLIGLLPLLFLARGGLVANSDILLAIPFLAVNIALVLAPALTRLPVQAAGVLNGVLALLLVALYWQTGALAPLYREQPAQAGREALAWIKQNLPADSRVITRDDLWTDLRSSDPVEPAFPNVQSHWKVAGDPAIKIGVFANDWRRVDYLLMEPGLEQDFVASNNSVALEALRHAHFVRRWSTEGGDAAFHPAQSIELWKVDVPGLTEQRLLTGSNKYLTQHFSQVGAYAEADGRVTSEAQSYALLRAVWSDDRTSFNETWQWTRDHLRQPNGLLAWNWRAGAVLDGNNATDADEDTALALLLAGKQWHDPGLLADGRQMVRAIWQHEVATVGGVPYLTAGNWAVDQPVIAINPSYFAPYAYRIFQEVDPSNNWSGVLESGYRLLAAAASAPLGSRQSAGLPPDWVGLDRATGETAPLRFGQGDTTGYGYDAARAYWRVALDLRWSGDGRAKSFLGQAGFLLDEVARKGYVSGVYAHDGTVLQEASTLVGNAGAVAALLTLNPDAANTLHAGVMVGGSHATDSGVYWGNPNDLYGQEWGWFATALYAGALPNLWRTP